MYLCETDNGLFASQNAPTDDVLGYLVEHYSPTRVVRLKSVSDYREIQAMLDLSTMAFELDGNTIRVVSGPDTVGEWPGEQVYPAA